MRRDRFSDLPGGANLSRNQKPPPSVYKIHTVGSFKTFVRICQIIRRHIPEYRRFKSRCGLVNKTPFDVLYQE
jgi:hypothetical protein